MRHERTLAIALSCALITLAGCGGHVESPGGANAVNTGDYLASAAGNHWVYEDSTTSTGTVVHDVGSATLQGRTGIRARATSYPLANPWQTGTAAESLQVEASGIGTRVPSTGSGAVDLALGPVDLYRLPATVGSSFVQADLTVDGPVDGDADGLPDRWVLHSTVTVVGVETVSVPAGRFDNCLHLRTVIDQRVTLSSNGQVQDSQTTRDDWYAPGVGPVRQDTTTVAGPVTGTSRLQLAAWRVGGRGSDSVAPSVLQTTPPDHWAGNAPASLAVQFSEPVDPTSARAGLRVIEAGGQAVAGTVSGSGSSVQWTPSAALAPGHYTLQIDAGVLDVAGNPLGTAIGVQFDVTGP